MIKCSWTQPFEKVLVGQSTRSHRRKNSIFSKFALNDTSSIVSDSVSNLHIALYGF